MKHLILFEKFAYLSKQDSDKIEDFIVEYMKNLNMDERINNMKLLDFESYSYHYFDIFTSSLSISKSGLNIYSEGNVYHAVDTFCKNNKLYFSTPALRNSMNNILKKIFNKYKRKFDNKLIELLQKKPEKYKSTFDIYENSLNNVVKKACEWMLNYKKYNL